MKFSVKLLFCCSLFFSFFLGSLLAAQVAPASGLFGSSQSTTRLLEKHGLSEVAKQLSGFIEIFDTGTHFFTKLNSDEHFVVLNLVISAFRESYLKTMKEVSNAKDAPTGEISLQMMKDLLDRQETHLKLILRKDRRIIDSEWSSFIEHIHLVFEALKDLYKLGQENGLSASWWMMNLTPPVMSMIPDDLFDREMFSEFLSLPATLKDTIHDMLEHLMKSDYAPMFKMAAHLAAKYDWRKHLNDDSEHPDL